MSEQKHEGLPVAGYRPQSQLAVDLVNRNKANEERQLRLLDIDRSEAVDPQWLAHARTHLEMAFMFWNRAIFQPTRAALPEDNRQQDETSS